MNQTDNKGNKDHIKSSFIWIAKKKICGRVKSNFPVKSTFNPPPIPRKAPAALGGLNCGMKMHEISMKRFFQSNYTKSFFPIKILKKIQFPIYTGGDKSIEGIKSLPPIVKHVWVVSYR